MFFEFGIKDFIDILLAAFLLYYTYKLMKASGSIKVFTGILVFILIWLVVTQVLEMKLLGSIFDTLIYRLSFCKGLPTIIFVHISRSVSVTVGYSNTLRAIRNYMNSQETLCC